MRIAGIDWIVLVLFFLLFLAMALYINGRVRSVADYLVSGRKVRMWLGMGAGIAGEIGLITIVGTCEQGYMRGYAFIFLGTLYMVVMVPLFGVFGFGIERFRASKAISVPQYIEMRYSRGLRILTGFSNSLAGVVQMCVFPIVGARFIRVLIGAPESVTWAGCSIESAWIIMTILLLCVVIFTFLGGYITLIVTNFFQMILIVVAVYGVFFLLIEKIGLQQFWSSLEESKGLSGFYPFTGEAGSYGTVWFSWLMLMSILLQFSYGPYLQKYASMDKPKTVSRSYLLGQIFGNGRTFVILGLGVAALAAMGPDMPVDTAMTEAQWQKMVTPYYLSQMVPVGLMGLLLAALLFADISTTDQYILSWATSIVNDCICPFKKTAFRSKQHIRAVRVTIMGLCLLFFIYGLFYVPSTPLWEYLWLCATIICGTGIAILFGMYWKRASTVGAYAAIVTCLALPLLDIVARQVYAVHEWTYPWTPETTGFFTFVLAIGLMLFFSLLSRQPSKYWDLGEEVKKMNRSG